MSWQPTASIGHLKQRAAILRDIRQFFTVREVMEVDTPALSHSAVTDVHLDSFQTKWRSPQSPDVHTLYLQTSPEFPMKRLLAAGSGCIYQICKVFRNDEVGRNHNPEFTLLEWYRVGFTLDNLMDEMDELLAVILATQPAERISYQQTFIKYLALDPLQSSLPQLKAACSSHGFADIAQCEKDPDTLLQLLFSHCIEPQIGQNSPCFVYDFPASQAALAKINPSDSRVAHRFEVYFKGVELANGFDELTQGTEQLMRFKQDNAKRKALGLPEQPIDYRLIDALKAGLPNCSGVALGIDRLVMLALAQAHIEGVLSFPTDRS